MSDVEFDREITLLHVIEHKGHIWWLSNRNSNWRRAIGRVERLAGPGLRGVRLVLASVNCLRTAQQTDPN
jgi:hypothetical protein